MFTTEIYSNRRNKLRSKFKNGILLFPGNSESAYNYKANTYSFRQDSSFLYFFGLDEPDLLGIIDIDENKDYIFGTDQDIEDVIWSGPQPKLSEKSLAVGIHNAAPTANLIAFLAEAIQKGRKVHFIYPYRADTLILLESILGIHHSSIQKNVSLELIKAVAELRSV